MRLIFGGGLLSPFLSADANEAKQVGWCFNCQIEIDMDGEFKKCNFECWVQIQEIKDLFKKAA